MRWMLRIQFLCRDVAGQSTFYSFVTRTAETAVNLHQTDLNRPHLLQPLVMCPPGLRRRFSSHIILGDMEVNSFRCFRSITVPVLTLWKLLMMPLPGGEGEWYAEEARTVTVVGLTAAGGGEESDCNSQDLSILLRLQGPEALAEVKMG